MCIFSQEVKSVEKTQIFARRAGSDRQYLVYSMSYSSASELAMILPLPTPPSSQEDAVRFINLSGYEEFFADLAGGFQAPPQVPQFLGFGEGSLEVHDVGSFEASFVPALADFARLDARFRLAGDVWTRLPDYADYGFAVFKLKPGAQLVHPMAFDFPTRAPAELFFPTVHVHDGMVRPTARFDHILYCQSTTPFEEMDLSWRYPSSLSGLWLNHPTLRHLYRLNTERAAPPKEWEISWKYPGSPTSNEQYRAELKNPANYIKAKEFVSIERARDIVDPGLPILRKQMVGTFRNTDVVLKG